LQKREGFRALLIGYHARLAKVKNVSVGISERQALSNLIRFSRSRDPSMKYDSLSTLMSPVDRFKRLLSCPGKTKLLEWFLPFLATVASSDAEYRRLAKDGGEVRMQTVYAYYTANESLAEVPQNSRNGLLGHTQCSSSGRTHSSVHRQEGRTNGWLTKSGDYTHHPVNLLSADRLVIELTFRKFGNGPYLKTGLPERKASQS
jgi:hypothetical protein